MLIELTATFGLFWIGALAIYLRPHALSYAPARGNNAMSSLFNTLHPAKQHLIDCAIFYEEVGRAILQEEENDLPKRPAMDDMPDEIHERVTFLREKYAQDLREVKSKYFVWRGGDKVLWDKALKAQVEVDRHAEGNERALLLIQLLDMPYPDSYADIVSKTRNARNPLQR